MRKMLHMELRVALLSKDQDYCSKRRKEIQDADVGRKHGKDFLFMRERDRELSLAEVCISQLKKENESLSPTLIHSLICQINIPT